MFQFFSLPSANTSRNNSLVLRIKEVILVGRPLVGVARRDRYADAELARQVEKLGDVFRGMAVIDGAVDVDGEAFGFRRLDGRYRLLEAARHAHRFVVVLLQTVEMHREKQIRRRLEYVQFLFQKECVGAQRNEFLARDNAFDDFADLLVDQRLAARNSDHRRAASSTASRHSWTDRRLFRIASG